MPDLPSKRLVTKELNAIMQKVIDVEPDGTPITHAQHFARTLINMALGYTEKKMHDNGTTSSIYHDPEPWALREVLDRYEGKPVAIVEESSERMIASERVTNMLRDRLNQMADKVTAIEQEIEPEKQ